MQVFCINYSYIFLSQKRQHKNSYMDSLLFYRNMILACASVLPVTAASYMDDVFFTPTCIVACASSLPVSAIYTRRSCTWFWLVWPNAGLLHELLVYFLARKGQHKNSHMDVLVFLPQYDSGLCACSTSASYIYEQPIHDSGLCGQMLVFCMNYWYIFWPGKANTRTPTWTFWSF